MKPSITPYTRHIAICKSDDSNSHRCGCPIWFFNPALPRGKQRYSAGTNDWNEALQEASGEIKASQPVARIMTEAAITEYLTSRSKKLKDADKAPYKDRYMLGIEWSRNPSRAPWGKGEQPQQPPPLMLNPRLRPPPYSL